MDTLAVIVNYKSADMTLRAVRSVLDAESLGPVQVVVVDNTGETEEAARLNRELPSVVRLEINSENIGFGRASNRAVQEFHGEAILLINPDAILLAGCLKRLQKTLFACRRAGAVSSRLFWDETLRFYLPSSYPPPSLIFQDLLEAVLPEAPISRFLSRVWRCHSIKVWRSKGPVRVRNLSGGLVLLKAKAVKAAHGLFDPRFFLYFEDTDLFLRIKKAGFTLLVEPRAQAVHNYDQCGQENLGQKRSIMAQSRQRFAEKYCRGWRRGANRLISPIRGVSGSVRRSLAPAHLTRPFVLKVPKHLQGGWLFEVSPNANFIPSAGRFGSGPWMDFPEACWRLLAPGHYFGRLGSPSRLGGFEQIVSWKV